MTRCHSWLPKHTVKCSSFHGYNGFQHRMHSKVETFLVAFSSSMPSGEKRVRLFIFPFLQWKTSWETLNNEIPDQVNGAPNKTPSGREQSGILRHQKSLVLSISIYIHCNSTFVLYSETHCTNKKFLFNSGSASFPWGTLSSDGKGKKVKGKWGFIHQLLPWT